MRGAGLFSFFSGAALHRWPTSRRWRLAPLPVLLAAAYLCFVNLHYAALWHDEAPAAILGFTLLETGDILGWDGRNLIGGENGRTLNGRLRDTFPPLTYALNAAGFAIFGFGEIGARAPHALMGVLALAVFWLLLRLYFPRRPRLAFFIFVFVALSAQLLLFFRQSRYYALAVFTFFAALYFYELYWREKKWRHWAAMTFFAVCAFFAHYAGAAAAGLSIAAWHLILRARQTSPRDWLLFAAAGLAVAGCGLGYLHWLGVLGGGFVDFGGARVVPYEGPAPRPLLVLYLHLRELFTADWVSWPLAIAFAAPPIAYFYKRKKDDEFAFSRVENNDSAAINPDEKQISDSVVAHAQQTENESQKESKKENNNSFVARFMAGAARLAPMTEWQMTARFALFGFLFAAFSGLLSVQQPPPPGAGLRAVADLRYYVAALPFLLAMKGWFVDALWRRGQKFIALGALAFLLITNYAAWPFHVERRWGGDAAGPVLAQFVREVHRPYPSAAKRAAQFLRRHAAFDDLVYVPHFYDREVMTIYIGDHVRFCCFIDRGATKLPLAVADRLPAPIYAGRQIPDWVISFSGAPPNMLPPHTRRLFAPAHYIPLFFYPTQRPALNAHYFTPPPATLETGVYIYRRISQ